MRDVERLALANPSASGDEECPDCSSWCVDLLSHYGSCDRPRAAVLELKAERDALAAKLRDAEEMACTFIVKQNGMALHARNEGAAAERARIVAFGRTVADNQGGLAGSWLTAFLDDSCNDYRTALAGAEAKVALMAQDQIVLEDQRDALRAALAEAEVRAHDKGWELHADNEALRAELDLTNRLLKAAINDRNAEADVLRAEVQMIRGTQPADAEALRARVAHLEHWAGLGEWKIDALSATVERLRGALRKYGRHDGQCDLGYTDPCTCGLDATLAEGGGG